MQANISNKPGQAPVRGLTESTVCFATQLDIGGKGYSGILGKETYAFFTARTCSNKSWFTRDGVFKRPLDHRSLKEKMTKKTHFCINGQEGARDLPACLVIIELI